MDPRKGRKALLLEELLLPHRYRPLGSKQIGELPLDHSRTTYACSCLFLSAVQGALRHVTSLRLPSL